MRNCQLKQTKYVSYNVQENAYCFLGALGIEMSKRGFNTPEEMIGGKVPKSLPEEERNKLRKEHGFVSIGPALTYEKK